MRPSASWLTDAATLLAAVSAVAILGAVIWGRNTSSRDASDPTVVIVEDWASYAESGHRLGPADAAVTIIEFGDYQCRYCWEAEPHLASIRRNYADDVALVYRHLPLVIESASYDAARAAECAGEQGLFWPFHDRLFSDRNWQIGGATDAWKRISVEVGIDDRVRFEACIGSDDPVPAITADLAAAAELGLSGTPAFLVNGRLSMGVLDSISFAEVFRGVRR